MDRIGYAIEKAQEIHRANRFRSCLTTIGPEDVRRMIKATDGIKLDWEYADCIARMIRIMNEADNFKK